MMIQIHNHRFALPQVQRHKRTFAHIAESPVAGGLDGSAHVLRIVFTLWLLCLSALPVYAQSFNTATDLGPQNTSKRLDFQYKVGSEGWKEVPQPRDPGYPITVPFNASVQFKATLPAGITPPPGKPQWGGLAGGTGSDKTVVFNSASTAIDSYKSVTVECGHSLTADVLVVKVEKLKYRFDDPNTTADDNDPFLDTPVYPEPLAVPVGSRVVFHAVKSPQVAPSLPTGKCLWVVDGEPAGTSLIIHDAPNNRDVETKAVQFDVTCSR